MSCPRCRSSSVIESPGGPLVCLSQSAMNETTAMMSGFEENSFRSQRSQSLCVSELRATSRDTSLMIPVRKQYSLPETSGIRFPRETSGPDQRMGVCQSIQCGFHFCVHCSYAFEPGHKCIEIGTLSPLIKQSRQPRVIACSKQSRRNLKRL